MARFRSCLAVFILLSPAAWAWGPSTHAYIASCVTEGQNLSVIFGAMLPDCNAIIRDNATEASQMNAMTHREFDRLAPSALATGFKTHNGIWGADSYAHLIFTPDPEEIYSVVKIRQLSDEFGIATSKAEDVFEMCVDVQMRLILGPSWGELLERAANAAGAAHEQAMVDAYASELAARAGLSQEEAESDIRMAFQGFKSLATTFGQQLQLDELGIHTVIPPVLAIYLGCDEATATTYYNRGLEITTDVMTEMDRICAEIKLQMPNAFEGEDEGEGEVEGEGEPVELVADFCQAFGLVFENPLLQGLDPEFAAFVNLLNPATADLNGTFNVDNSGGTLTIEVTGNGILDAANELGLLAHLMNHPDPFLSGIRTTVLNREDVVAAWQANLAQLDQDIGPLAALVATVVPGLKEVLAGFITLGDGEFTVTSAPTPENPTAPIIASGSGSFGLVAAMFATLDTMLEQELGSGFANPNISLQDYVTLSAFLPGSDADGDGYTNREEYDYFTPNTCSGGALRGHKGNTPETGYTQAALNYRICPDCESACYDCANPRGGLYAVGQDACLRVPGSFAPGTPFDWSKEGAGPLFGARYGGLDCQSLTIVNLMESDSGTYICTYGGDEQVYRVSIIVGETLPLFHFSWPLAFGLLSVACLAAAIRRYRTGTTRS